MSLPSTFIFRRSSERFALEHGRARQTVGVVETAGDVPAHIPEDAAEIEDDGAEANSACRLAGEARARGSARSCRATVAASRAA